MITGQQILEAIATVDAGDEEALFTNTEEWLTKFYRKAFAAGLLAGADKCAAIQEVVLDSHTAGVCAEELREMAKGIE